MRTQPLLGTLAALVEGMITRSFSTYDHHYELIRRRQELVDDSSGSSLAFSGAVLLALAITCATAICCFLALRPL
ncbi:MAG: hypothetical protein H0U43_07135 [Chthoniobacterales bacterium]|nr:hypothetical protein [Chthoniobacterales bacterium]